LGVFLLPRQLARLRLIVIAAIAAHLFYLLNIQTTGTCEYGPRYLLPLLPLLAVGVAALVDLGGAIAFPAKLLAAGSMLAYGFVVNLIGALQGSIYCNLGEFAIWEKVAGLNHLPDGICPLSGIVLMVGATTLPVWAWSHFHLAVSLDQPAAWMLVRRKSLLFAFWAGACSLFYLFTRDPNSFFDYTFRIAEAMLHGRLGVTDTPPSWLNEMVPHQGIYYSVFPLGSVLAMIPVALLKVVHLLDAFPGGIIAAWLAGTITLMFYFLSAKYPISLPRRVLLSLFPVFATWTWCNLTFSGAWHIALGFAMLGEAGALYYTLVKRKPLLAGFFFALAFGNRTEIVLTAPIFLYFLFRRSGAALAPASTPDPVSESVESEAVAGGAVPAHAQTTGLTEPGAGRRRWNLTVDMSWSIVRFLIVPLVLGGLTLAYNHARFNSCTDFGYAHIPGVLQEADYKYGIFSWHAIPKNSQKMLLETWKRLDHYPYLVPTGFGGSLFLSSPFLLLLFRRRSRDRGVVWASWIAIFALTLALWCHGNPGGWQYSYRYAMILIPWMFVVLLEQRRPQLSGMEIALFTGSVAINAYATYLFWWTDYVRP
jgi:hypothetical protein